MKGTASHSIEQRIARSQEIGQRLAHAAAGEVLEIHFGEAKGRLLRRKGEVASFDDRECAAETIAVDHRDGRLWIIPQRAEAPFRRDAEDAVELRRIVLQVHEELLEVHPRAERLPSSGDDEDTRCGLIAQLFQNIRHFEMQRGTHGVALGGPIERNDRDGVLDLDSHRVGFGHGSLSLLGTLVRRGGVMLHQPAGVPTRSGGSRSRRCASHSLAMIRRPVIPSDRADISQTIGAIITSG